VPDSELPETWAEKTLPGNVFQIAQRRFELGRTVADAHGIEDPVSWSQFVRDCDRDDAYFEHRLTLTTFIAAAILDVLNGSKCNTHLPYSHNMIAHSFYCDSLPTWMQDLLRKAAGAEESV